MNCHIYIAYLIVIIHLSNGEQSLQCGDWDVYKDEKCFKVFENKELQNFENAKSICYQNEASSLVTIRSQEEHDFLYNLIHNVHKTVNDVWIGAQFKDKSLKWSENITVNYTNWANGYPINDSGYECVLLGMIEPNLGKWLNEPCERNNLVICEKRQNWLFSYLQKTVMDLRESFENITLQLESSKLEIEKTKIELQSTKLELQNNKIRLENTEKSLLEKTTEASPSGTIAYFSNTNPPKGWLKANGQSVSRTTYAALFAVIGTTFGAGDGNTTFLLPDLRGEFIRGWSDGRDVDTNRTFGSFQFGSSIPMVGYIDKEAGHPHSSAHHDRWYFAGESFDNGFESNVPSGETRDGIKYPNDNKQNFVSYANYTNSGVITSWNIYKGTRPRNIALLACIKY